MENSFNDTKDNQRKSFLEESMLESTSGILLEKLHRTNSTNDSGIGPDHMEISKNTYENSDSELSRSSSPSLETKYFCPLCDQTYTSQHEFTLHIRSHNTENEDIKDEKAFSCKICSKSLSSGSSLDRHMLVHSGERPFSCKICSVTFTTNGNMHRHMRTHSQKGENYESDGSTDSGSSSCGIRSRKRRLEFNNNKLENKNTEDLPKKPRHINNNNLNEVIPQVFRCPVCSRDDFPSLNVMEQHLEDNHPDFEVKCNLCNSNFKNHKALNLHKYMIHNSDILTANKNLKNSIPGFKDLTFVDFSSEKFPHIARYACEKSPHKPITGQKFICDDCSLAFPCASALEIHQQDCRKREGNNPTDLSRKSDSEEDLRRDNFFAHLDLQNKSKPPSPINDVQEEPVTPKIEKIIERPPIDSKDLADIQSILAMTSNGLQHLRPKPTPELLAIPSDHQKNCSDHPEEETQDAFAAEFRKMKLRGEFPCRLCTAVFPNLRALKGHNRAHLSGNTGPYRCNMCPHSSVDKAALIRHMRTHNGDRPYECSLCNYAFTTKANCERHLRNRHAKVTREEVKKSIIYHPSEDPTNDDKLNSTRDEIKRSFLNSSNEEGMEKVNSSTPKDNNRHPDFSLLMPKELGINIPQMITKDLSYNDHSPLIQVNKELAVFKERLTKEEPILKPTFNILRERIEESFKNKDSYTSIDGLKQIPEYEPEENMKETSQNSSGFEDYSKSGEHPIDLSSEVLDLSKKKPSSSPEPEDEPVDFTKKTLENSLPPGLPPAAHFLLAQTLLKNPICQNYAALIPGLQNLSIPQIPFNPFLFNPSFFNTAQEMKERMLRLQLQSGGSMITDQFSPVPSERAFQSTPPDMAVNFPNNKVEEDKVPLHVNTHLGDSVAKLQSPKSQKMPEISHSPNSVKMVIKNGVLMPKQKQRRYRTERPFSCEHCSARFTLRSNMERHIKQQHPQFWSQRQRSGLTAGRKPMGPMSSTPIPNPKTSFYDLNIPNFDLTIPKVDPIVNDTKDISQPLSISQQVKYAILAQHLKANKDLYNDSYPSPTKDKLDDDDDALIIDEENDEKPITKNDLHSTPENTNDLVKSNSTLEDKLLQLRQLREAGMNLSSMKTNINKEDTPDLSPVSRILDNAVSRQLPFEFSRREGDDTEIELGIGSEEDEEGLIASASASEGNGSSCDENKSENENQTNGPVKKKSAYSLAPNRVSCPYCSRKFPWTSSLRRHILTHTGQKPFKCPQCPLLFTTKSNCDRHLLRKHGNNSQNSNNTTNDPTKNNSQSFMMRNVPERPFKCSNCPSSTFSTLSNLNKHMSCKHLKSDSEKRSDYESHASSEDERNIIVNEKPHLIENKDWEQQISHTKILNETLPNSELPFKCHLCEGSFAERQEALDHIKEIHVSEYELLLSKGALDQNVNEEMHQNHETEDDDQIRGKFPDYANRKVVCAFCMRRFWSAEDLRRHMRTHSGERPFSCDVCRRRFTLKHSMLRHRKKHNTTNNDEVPISGDEENVYDKLNISKININNNNLENLKNSEKSDDSEGNEGNDLIGNLLGIRDKSIIDQVLDGSADDAAKLLGVNSGRE